MSQTQVTRSDARSRYELFADGAVAGHADFVRAGDAVRLTHTEIDPQHGGKGYGSLLAAAVIADIRAQGLQVVAECEFMANYIRKRSLG